ncbi:MAG: OsmC family protein [Planctomycetota bacterium]
MSEHTATIHWERGDTEFTYQTYSRNHTVTFPNGHVIESSAAVDFMGDPDKVDPEEMLVAALSNCHMLTFLALAAKKRLVVESYTDRASGVVGTLENKRMAVTAVTLRPEVTFGGPEDKRPDAETIDAMHHKAHDHCFIANSVNCDIRVEAK